MRGGAFVRGPSMWIWTHSCGLKHQSDRVPPPNDVPAPASLPLTLTALGAGAGATSPALTLRPSSLSSPPLKSPAMKLRAKRFVFVGLFAGLSANSAFACSAPGLSPPSARPPPPSAHAGIWRPMAASSRSPKHRALLAARRHQFRGDGRTTFGLPDLPGRTRWAPALAILPVDASLAGRSPALQVTISLNQMPYAHRPDEVQPRRAIPTVLPAQRPPKLARSNNYSTAGADTNMAPTRSPSEPPGSQPMAIGNPYTGLLFCIAAEGIFRLGPESRRRTAWLRLVVRFPRCPV